MCGGGGVEQRLAAVKMGPGHGMREWYLAAVQKCHSPNVLGKLFHVEVNVVIELALLICHRSHGFVDAGDEDFPLLVYQAAWGK